MPRGDLKEALICSTFTIILIRAGAPVLRAELRALMFIQVLFYNFGSFACLSHHVKEFHWPCSRLGGEAEEAGKGQRRKTEAAWIRYHHGVGWLAPPEIKPWTRAPDVAPPFLTLSFW